MILLFPYLDFIPFAVPRYLLFRDKLRISFRWVMFLIIAMATVNAAVFYFFNAAGYAFAAQWTTAIRYGFMLMNLILSFALIKDSFAKLMFTYLLLFAWSFFVFGNANFQIYIRILFIIVPVCLFMVLLVLLCFIFFIIPSGRR